MLDFSIIVPHRGNALGLWSTIHSCEEELMNYRTNGVQPEFGGFSKYSYEYVVVSNGERLDIDALSTVKNLESAGKLVHKHYDEILTPPVARSRAVSLSSGKRLFFFDNHCLVGKQYFDRAMASMDEDGMDMLHSTTSYYSMQPRHYHYKLLLDYNFWGNSVLVAPHWKSYKCAAGGHGGFCVTREAWDSVGGYGPETLFSGYGGEELIFDLKMWRMGRTNWLDPRLLHHHYAGIRGYSRHYTDDYYTNLLVSAHVIGGEKWLYNLFESFVTKRHPRLRPRKEWYRLLEDAYFRSVEYAQVVDSMSVYSLDELLEFFKSNDVAM